MSRSALLGLVGVVLAACSGEGEPATDASTDASETTDVIELDEGPAPESTLENALVATAADELFPHASEHGVVFIRAGFDASALEPEQEAPNCFQCPHCVGCEWSVVHRPFDCFGALACEQAETLLETTAQLDGAPRIHQHRVVWTGREEPGTQREVFVHDLLSGERTAVHPNGAQGWNGPTPELRGATLYWHGYHHMTGQSGLFATDVDSGDTELAVVAQMHRHYFQTSGAAQRFGPTQPFAMDDSRAVWVANTNQGLAVFVWPLEGGEASVVWQDSEYHAMLPAISGDTIAWGAYERDQGCHEYKCDMVLKAQVAGQVIDIGTSATRPSRYAPPAFMGSHLVWTDYRHGRYALYAADLDAPSPTQTRLTSDEAILSSAQSPIIQPDSGVLWMDRRDGNWDVFSRPVP